MSETREIVTYQPEALMVTRTESARIDRYIGLDYGLRKGGRRARLSASPEFLLTIRSEKDGDIIEDDYIGNIVAAAVPERDTTKIPTGTPVAIGEVEFQDDVWYLMFSTDPKLGEIDLSVSEMLVQYDGEPEDLLTRPELFEPAED